MSQHDTGERRATISRATLETQIEVALCLDGSGQCELDTGLPFLEHMLDQIARHGQIDLNNRLLKAYIKETASFCSKFDEISSRNYLLESQASKTRIFRFFFNGEGVGGHKSLNFFMAM